MIGARPIRLEIDGGANPETAARVAEAGADTIVAGSAVFRGGTERAYRTNIAALRAAAGRAKGARANAGAGPAEARKEAAL